jgi:hypothetical protein
MPSPVGLAEVVDLDRVRVLELRDGADLALEAREDLRVAREVRVQRLDRDLARLRAELLLALVDGSPCRLRRGADDLVLAAERLADHRVGGLGVARLDEHVPQLGQKRCDSSRRSGTWGIAWVAEGSSHNFGALRHSRLPASVG